MTKLRAPLTFADATTRVAGVIGWDTMARMSGRAERTVRAWSEPDSTASPQIDQALAFDAAYRKAGGDGAPFLDAYAFQLDIAIERQDACARALLGELAIAAKESGEAFAAAIAVTSSNASPLDAHRAFAEAQQAATACDAVVRRLACFLPSGAGLEAGNTGGFHQ